jgi:hypothetical protein
VGTIYVRGEGNFGIRIALELVCLSWGWGVGKKILR